MIVKCWFDWFCDCGVIIRNDLINSAAVAGEERYGYGLAYLVLDKHCFKGGVAHNGELTRIGGVAIGPVCKVVII